MRGCTGQRSEIMSAFRGLRSSEGHHGAPGRSLLTQTGHAARLTLVSIVSNFEQSRLGRGKHYTALTISTLAIETNAASNGVR